MARRFALLAALLASFVAGATVGHADHLSTTGTKTFATCNFQGVSDFVYTPVTLGYAWTGKVSSACPSEFHVHAYFLGSDSIYHYMEATNTGLKAEVDYFWWTDDAYGYHQYPAGWTTYTTHAY